MTTKPNEENLSHQSFGTDTEYLDAEFSALKLSIQLLDLERQLDDAAAYMPDPNAKQVGRVELVSSKELTRRLIELRDEELLFRQQLNSRMEVHRQSGSFRLGLDIIAESAELSADERKILIALALPAINVHMANDVLAAVNLYGPELQVNELITLLNPKNSEDWLRFRQLFHIEAPLIRKELIAIEYPGKTVNPSDLLYASVHITMRTLGMISGHLELACEGGCPGGDESH